MIKLKGLSIQEYIEQEYHLFNHHHELSRQMPLDKWKGLEIDMDVGEDLLNSFSYLSPEWLAGINLHLLFKDKNALRANYSPLKEILNKSPKRKIAMLFAHGVDNASEYYAENGKIVDSKSTWIYEHALGIVPEYATQFVISCNPQRKVLNAFRIPLFYVMGDFEHSLEPSHERILSMPTKETEGRIE